MKKCPYCAEEIKDEAIKCRFCGSRLRKPAKVVKPIIPEFVTPTHFGELLALGIGRQQDGDFYCIWDGRDGEVTAKFPMDDDGWTEAWEIFSAAEPITVEGASPPPGFPRLEVDQAAPTHSSADSLTPIGSPWTPAQALLLAAGVLMCIGSFCRG